MKSPDIRERYLAFFAARGHARVASDSLIPSGDATVLFTSAGMNQFKDCFLGKRTDLTRATSSQKCLRTGDLERVGKTASHHSFFEMLGNFSFGDYFKKEAIGWAWEFLTGTLDYAGRPSPDQARLCLALPKARLWVSIYEDDQEAFDLWQALGVPADRIVRKGQADNFWPANAPNDGPNGPCGPCSEIYYDAAGAVDGPNSTEIWNLVFTQYDRQSDGSLRPLPKPNIDTGMGLERLTRVIQGVPTDYETDLFEPIVAGVAALRRTGAKEQPELEKAIADHARGITYLIGEGLIPSNEGRGYVLRLLIRRTALRMEKALGIGAQSPELIERFAGLVAHVVAAAKRSPYEQELQSKRTVIEQVLTRELQQFQQTLQSGSERLTSLIGRATEAKRKALTGEEAFELYDTYGFPYELTADMANDKGMTVDRKGFEAALDRQRERSRAKSQFGGEVFAAEKVRVRESVKDVLPKEAQFTGYDRVSGEARLLGIWDGTHWVTEAKAGAQVGLVLDRSPFYGEAGGQIGDAGVIEGPKGRADVGQTTWIDEVLVHHATVRDGALKVHDPVKAQVDAARRLRIARSHTATHLLHWALRTVLGPDAVQAGSYVESERVRFDFSSLSALKDEQRYEVEQRVRSRVNLVDPVATQEMGVEAAKQYGALALFGEKYGAKVRVVTIGDYSRELCGGTHVLHTGFVGGFQIVSESSIAAGTRRVEAVVGDAAALLQREQERLLHEAALRLGRPAHDLVTGLEELLEQIKRLERERKTLQLELAKVQAGRLVAEGKKIDGITFVTSSIKDADRELLAALADAVKRSLEGEGVVLLASSEGPAQVSLVMAATAGVMKRVNAGQVVKAIAPLTQGSGGGRPEFAQAGGKNPAGIPAALKRAEELVREALHA